MQLPELLRTLRQLGLSGLADTLESRLIQAQADQLAPADFLVPLLQDELTGAPIACSPRPLRQ